DWSSSYRDGTTAPVAPKMTGYSFSPPSRVVSGPAGGLNFTGYFSFALSGRITAADGTPVAGVQVTFSRPSGARPVRAAIPSDAQGTWRQPGFQPGSASLVPPAKPACVFAPPSRTAADGAVGLDFTATPQVSVSGRVTDGAGAGIAGVTMSFVLETGA